VQQSEQGVSNPTPVLPQCSPSAASERQIDRETTEGTVRGRIIAVNDATDDEILAWRDLARRAAQPNPLFEVDCLVPAARHLRNGPDISLVLAEESGRFFGCFPVQRAARWKSLPRPVLATQVRRMQYDGTPLLDAERGHEAMVAMLQALREGRSSGTPGFVVFDWLDDAGPATRHLRQAALTLGLGTYQYEHWERAMIHRRPDGDYRALHGKKFLHNVARLRRRWEEELGAAVRLVDHRDDRDAVDAFLALEAAGYKSTTGIATELYPDEMAWFRELCDRFREAGRLRLWSLEAGDGMLAAEIGLTGDEGLFILKVAYDEAQAKYTPGVQLHLDVIDQLDAMTGVEWIDPCTYAKNDTLERMFPDHRSMGAIVVATGGLADRGLLRAVAIARRHLRPGSPLRRHLPGPWRST
jgi:CelD/BcsL family acetyltransferase involved in cellulose biosynthesis